MSHDTNVDPADSYEAPVVVDHGRLLELTAAGSGGTVLDASFPAGTPRGDLTSTTP